MSDLSEMMHWLQGSCARDYRIRRSREGASIHARWHWQSRVIRELGRQRAIAELPSGMYSIACT